MLIRAYRQLCNVMNSNFEIQVKFSYYYLVAFQPLVLSTVCFSDVQVLYNQAVVLEKIFYKYSNVSCQLHEQRGADLYQLIKITTATKGELAAIYGNHLILLRILFRVLFKQNKPLNCSFPHCLNVFAYASFYC